MNIKRFSICLALVAIFAVACEDVSQPPPPLPPAQISHGIHFTRTFDNNGRQNGLQDNDVFDMLVASTGEMWIANRGGIAVYPNVGTPVRSKAYDQNNALNVPWTSRLLEHNGKIYAGTWGGGVGIYDIAGDTWTNITTADGLADDHVSDIEEFQGNLYFATSNGVTFYDPVADTTESYAPLDPIVSAIAIAPGTPRGLEYFYTPRVEFGIDPGTEGDHGITISREYFNAFADTVRIAPTRDNTIYAASDTLSNGMGTSFVIGLGPTVQSRHSLIHFDIAGNVPPSSRIVRATLRVRMIKGDFRLMRVSIFPAEKDWGEAGSIDAGDGSRGAPAQTGDATWTHTFFPSSNWDTPGGDFGRLSARIAIRDTAYYDLRSNGMIEDVQGWLRNPASNFGWVLSGEDSLKAFASREHPNVAFRPELEVVFRRMQEITPVDSDLPSLNVTDALYDAATDLYWLTFATEGIATVDVSNSVWNFFTTRNGLPSNQVYALINVDGVYWAATQNGIARQLGTGNWQGYNTGGGLKADRVRRVTSDQPDRIWLSYIDAGGGRVDPNSAQ